MNPATLQTCDIFYYDSHTSYDGKTHHHKCRVLFVGSESLSYDAWWDGLKQWTFVPVKKRLAYYRFPLTTLPKLPNLNFIGSEPIDRISAEKLFLNSPEILFKSTKEMMFQSKSDRTLVEVNCNTIAFIPIGPKGGALKPVLLECTSLNLGMLTRFILEHQNLDFIAPHDIVLHRVGLHDGVPSYSIRKQ